MKKILMAMALLLSVAAQAQEVEISIKKGSNKNWYSIYNYDIRDYEEWQDWPTTSNLQIIKKNRL